MSEFVDVMKKRKEICKYYEGRCGASGCPIDIIKKSTTFIVTMCLYSILKK